MVTNVARSGGGVSPSLPRRARTPEGDTSSSFDERSELESLYRTHFQPMVRLAWGLTGSRAVAEELVQDAFVRLHGRLAGVEHPAAYLRTAVVNACRGHHRRVRSRLRMAAEPAPAGAAPEVIELWDALEVLSARQRAAVVLRFYEDLPEAEVAQILGCRPGTVKSLTSRALERLREVVER